MSMGLLYTLERGGGRGQRGEGADEEARDEENGTRARARSARAWTDISNRLALSAACGVFSAARWRFSDFS